MAEHFGLSASHFTALFRKHFHTSPMSYLNSHRMHSAARLLRLYPYNSKEVADLTGFRDPLYFSKRFRQHWGLSPSEYRKKHQS